VAHALWRVSCIMAHVPALKTYTALTAICLEIHVGVLAKKHVASVFLDDLSRLLGCNFIHAICGVDCTHRANMWKITGHRNYCPVLDDRWMNSDVETVEASHRWESVLRFFSGTNCGLWCGRNTSNLITHDVSGIEEHWMKLTSVCVKMSSNITGALKVRLQNWLQL